MSDASHEDTLPLKTTARSFQLTAISCQPNRDEAVASVTLSLHPVKEPANRPKTAANCYFHTIVLVSMTSQNPGASSCSEPLSQ
jgi:hypothetical protein